MVIELDEVPPARFSVNLDGKSTVLILRSPPEKSPGRSGVNDFVSVVFSIRFDGMMSNAKDFFSGSVLESDVLLSIAPLYRSLDPRTWRYLLSTIVTDGIRLTTSALLASGVFLICSSLIPSPIASDFFRSMSIALSVDFTASAVTTTSSTETSTPESPMSSVADSPAFSSRPLTTFTPYPIIETLRSYVPGGTFFTAYLPSRSADAPSVVPVTRIVAPTSGSRVVESTMVPRISAVCCENRSSGSMKSEDDQRQVNPCFRYGFRMFSYV